MKQARFKLRQNRGEVGLTPVLPFLPGQLVSVTQKAGKRLSVSGLFCQIISGNYRLNRDNRLPES